MNSFALLQDEVEDDAASLSNDDSPSPDSRPSKDQSASVPNDSSSSASKPDASAQSGDKSKTEDGTDASKSPDAPPKQKDLTLEEYLAQKAALSNAVGNLNNRGLRKANDGQDGFATMSVLEKVDAKEVMTGVPVKEVQQAKGLKDSTHATVARNAEIQKFFQRDPNERRPYNPRGGRGGPRGEYRGSRGRGGFERGGRGGFERGRGGDRGHDRGGRGGGMSFGGDRGDRGDRGGRGGGFGGGDRGGRGGGFNGGDRSDRGGRGGGFSCFDRGSRGGAFGEHRGGRGGERGRGGDRGGRGRGRGPYRGDGYRPHDGGRGFGGKSGVVVAPDVDDISAFPSL